MRSWDRGFLNGYRQEQGLKARYQRALGSVTLPSRASPQRQRFTSARFAQGRLLSRAAILDGCLSVFEVEVLGQTLGPGPISEGGSGAPGAHRSAAILDLDRKRPCWASHEFVVTFGGEGSPDCVG